MITSNTPLSELFVLHKICVLVPTYNNAALIGPVVKELLTYTNQVVVVNDGSTDDTLQVLAQFPEIDIVSYCPNKGKGNALLTGFRHAYNQGYTYAITIDSDGQHYPKDLVAFVHYIIEHPGSLIIGARNMDQSHIPGKSTFGNKFSNFWFWVETGKTLTDTQSGYRLYPLDPIVHTKYFSTKYEFEIEAPVRASWKGVPIAAVPVEVYYPPEGERVSHFRPFKDFSRISVLNTFLTIIALFWIHPRDFIKQLMTKQGWKDLWNKSFIKAEESNFRKASSLGFGVFMGVVPIWGFQLAVGIPLSILMKLNKPLFLLGANISIFPITPVFWLLSLMVGKWILGYEDWQYDIPNFLSLEQVMEAGFSFFLGGTILALFLGALTFLLVLGCFNLFRKGNGTSTASS